MNTDKTRLAPSAPVSWGLANASRSKRDEAPMGLALARWEGNEIENRTRQMMGS
jgi:hypothetical protein